MAEYVQRSTIAGYVWILQCVTCGCDIRGKPDEELAEVRRRWRGAMGEFNGKREYLCDLCMTEANTGVHAGGWRW